MPVEGPLGVGPSLAAPLPWLLLVGRVQRMAQSSLLWNSCQNLLAGCVYAGSQGKGLLARGPRLLLGACIHLGPAELTLLVAAILPCPRHRLQA